MKQHAKFCQNRFRPFLDTIILTLTHCDPKGPTDRYNAINISLFLNIKLLDLQLEYRKQNY